MEIDATRPHTTARNAAKNRYRCLAFDDHRDAWDQWIRFADHASASQLAGHLNSFKAYRATVSLHVIEDEAGRWLCAAGLLAWQIPGLRAGFGVCVGGPAGDVNHWPALIGGISSWCRNRRFICLEMAPHISERNSQVLSMLAAAGFRPAPFFAPVSGLGAELRVHLQDRSDEDLLNSFRRQTRQHVLKSLAEDYQVDCPRQPDEIDQAIEFMYRTSCQNGIEFGPLNRFAESVHAFVESGTGYVMVVQHQGRALAGGVFARAGRAHNCYRLATLRDPIHGRAAYRLHWQAISTARKEQFPYYHLTGRSTASVYQFKRGFRPEEIDLVGAHRLVLRPILMRSIETARPVAAGAAKQILPLMRMMRRTGN